MSGFLSNVFSAGSGNSANTDRKNTLAGFGDLSNVFNFGLNQAKSGEASGQQTQKSALGQLAGPAQYYQSLLSGNRQAALAAAAPTVNAANSQVDAQKKALATGGTGRGGGTNATSQQLDTARMSSVDNSIQNAKTGAAAGATQVAGQTGAIGAEQLNNATKLLGLGTEAASDLTRDSIASRKDSQELHDQKSKQYADIATSALDILFGA